MRAFYIHVNIRVHRFTGNVKPDDWLQNSVKNDQGGENTT